MESRSIDRSGHRYGNFSSYYSFHSAESRTSLFPPGCFIAMWEAAGRPVHYYMMDVGCNDGSLSLQLLDKVQEELGDEVKCHMLGVDIDAALIQRASKSVSIAAPSAEDAESGTSAPASGSAAASSSSTSGSRTAVPPRAAFKCVDIMSTFDASADGCAHHPLLSGYIREMEGGAGGFHLISLFSITMWVHTNHGDAGLQYFYDTAEAHLSNGGAESGARTGTGTGTGTSTGSDGQRLYRGSIIVEPQPWKCYRSAKKRCSRTGVAPPPHIGTVSITDAAEHAVRYFHGNAIRRRRATRQQAGSSSSSSVSPGCYGWGLGNESCWGRAMIIFHMQVPRGERVSGQGSDASGAASASGESSDRILEGFGGKHGINLPSVLEAAASGSQGGKKRQKQQRAVVAVGVGVEASCANAHGTTAAEVREGEEDQKKTKAAKIED